MKQTMKKTLLTTIAAAALIGTALPASAQFYNDDYYRDYRYQEDRERSRRDANLRLQAQRDADARENRRRAEERRIAEERRVDRNIGRGRGVQEDGSPMLRRPTDVYQGPTYNETTF